MRINVSDLQYKLRDQHGLSEDSARHIGYCCLGSSLARTVSFLFPPCRALVCCLVHVRGLSQGTSHHLDLHLNCCSAQIQSAIPPARPTNRLSSGATEERLYFATVQKGPSCSEFDAPLANLQPAAVREYLGGAFFIRGTSTLSTCSTGHLYLTRKRLRNAS